MNKMHKWKILFLRESDSGPEVERRTDLKIKSQINKILFIFSSFYFPFSIVHIAAVFLPDKSELREGAVHLSWHPLVTQGS